jgi:ELWxxDGT repeat protein
MRILALLLFLSFNIVAQEQLSFLENIKLNSQGVFEKGEGISEIVLFKNLGIFVIAEPQFISIYASNGSKIGTTRIFKKEGGIPKNLDLHIKSVFNYPDFVILKIQTESLSLNGKKSSNGLILKTDGSSSGTQILSEFEDFDSFDKINIGYFNSKFYEYEVPILNEPINYRTFIDPGKKSAFTKENQLVLYGKELLNAVEGFNSSIQEPFVLFSINNKAFENSKSLQFYPLKNRNFISSNDTENPISYEYKNEELIPYKKQHIRFGIIENGMESFEFITGSNSPDSLLLFDEKYNLISKKSLPRSSGIKSIQKIDENYYLEFNIDTIPNDSQGLYDLKNERFVVSKDYKNFKLYYSNKEIQIVSESTRFPDIKAISIVNSEGNLLKEITNIKNCFYTTNVGFVYNKIEDSKVYAYKSNIETLLLDEGFELKKAENFKERILFCGLNISTKQSKIYTSNGQKIGTILLKTSTIPEINFEDFVVNELKFYFRYYDEKNGFEPWESDGTPDRTWILRDLYQGKSDGLNKPIKVVNNVPLALINTPDLGYQLFLLKKFNPAPIILSPSQEICGNKEVILAGPNNYDEYIWYRNSAEIQRTNTPTLKISQSGSYQLETMVRYTPSYLSWPVQINYLPEIKSPQILQENQLLYIEGTYANIQWYLDGVPVLSQNSNKINIEGPGNYTVEIKAGSCTAVSDAKKIIVLSNSISDKQLKIYPNPAKNYIVIENLNPNSEIQLLDLQGKTIPIYIENEKLILPKLQVANYILKIDTKTYKININ